MLCKVCIRGRVPNAFTDGGSANFRKDKLVQHDRSKQHKLACERSRTIDQTAPQILEPVRMIHQYQCLTDDHLCDLILEIIHVNRSTCSINFKCFD